MKKEKSEYTRCTNCGMRYHVKKSYQNTSNEFFCSMYCLTRGALFKK